jgi:hypothetical protein
MKVFGVSQTTGVERRLNVERGVGDGVVLIITDHAGDEERARILVKAGDLMATVIEPAPGGSTVEGTSPSHGTKLLLRVEVRRNEVWLSAGTGADVAVGLDDFQDALEGAVPRA